MAIEPNHAAQGRVWNTAWNRWEWRNEHGQLHRIGAPAIIYLDGGESWFLHGQCHRVAGPAVIHKDGLQAWYLHGECHRVAGPAVIYPSGIQYWYVYGRNITKEVAAWMQANSITWPFHELQQTEFALRWL
jgi:hypothetical protein